MSETALKGSIVSSPSPSPPPTFPRLGSRPKSIAKQYAAALALASTTDSSVDDLHKITWGQRRFIIASLLDRRKSRGRRSWIGNHGWFLAELKRDNTSSGDIWCCRLCDDKGAPRFFNAQSTSSAQAHLYKLSDFPISRLSLTVSELIGSPRHSNRVHLTIRQFLIFKEAHRRNGQPLLPWFIPERRWHGSENSQLAILLIPIFPSLPSRVPTYKSCFVS
ncbi:hypothetical protein FOMA001_g19219 [Fusarium oxysporum f. sp. matthiolae]|nr:hypothetical protein FOMA001_g19219 [Fusarium oxysporum f. sp. matthiolae]